jgi:hypothetical protein
MQVIENLTRLRGRIIRRVTHPARAGYDLLAMQVLETEAVQGKADLLGRHISETLDIAVRSELLQDAKVSDIVDLRAKMTLDGALAESHPESGNFNIVTSPESNPKR